MSKKTDHRGPHPRRHPAAENGETAGAQPTVSPHHKSPDGPEEGTERTLHAAPAAGQPSPHARLATIQAEFEPWVRCLDSIQGDVFYHLPDSVLNKVIKAVGYRLEERRDGQYSSKDVPNEHLMQMAVLIAITSGCARELRRRHPKKVKRCHEVLPDGTFLLFPEARWVEEAS